MPAPSGSVGRLGPQHKNPGSLRNAHLHERIPDVGNLTGTAASHRLGAPVIGSDRGGASDASHFAGTIALTVDGLGPRGGGAHTPHEFVLQAALPGV